MKRKFMRFLIWVLKKLEDEPNSEIEIYRLNGKVILPDDLSADVVKLMIEFEEPVSPARVMENLDGGCDIKNPLPDRTFILYGD